MTELDVTILNVCAILLVLLIKWDTRTPQEKWEDGLKYFKPHKNPDHRIEGEEYENHP